MNDQRKFNIADGILIILIIFFLLFLYQSMRGEINFLSSVEIGSGEGGPADNFLNGVNDLGQGIDNLFRELIP